MLVNKDKLQKIIEKHLRSEHGWGYAVSIELDGKPLFKHYSGVVEHDNVFYSVDENTMFNAASISKQFTACCIAILVCENRIDLNNSVRVYLPDMDEYADKITLRHLLAMTSGVRNIYGLKHLIGDTPLGEMELFYRQKSPAHDAGNFYGYCDASYYLLGQIVEKLTGSTPQFAKQKIFDPLGMKNARGLGDMGAGDVEISANDLAIWHNCLMTRNLPGAPDGLFDLIYSRFTFNNGELCPYGFGFFYDENDSNIIWQFGDNTGWQSVIRAYLIKKLSVIVMTHFKVDSYDPVEMALELENMVINELFNMPEQENYKRKYFRKPWHTSNMRKVAHVEFPNAQKQNIMNEKNWDKYLGRYYGYEVDTYFDIIPDGDRIQMKYADRDDEVYHNLLDFSDLNNVITRTHGDWADDRMKTEFFGNEHEINFFTMQKGCGHFYFVKQ